MENKIRGDIHILMVGDPGTGKSRLLYAAKRLSNKAIMTTGMGTSAAGLTVAAMKDKNSNEWVLEAGALALADRGVCCIDEFSLLKNEDKSSIHEIMEQQTLNVSKAGIHCQVNMRSTIIAACNPTISDRRLIKT